VVSHLIQCVPSLHVAGSVVVALVVLVAHRALASEVLSSSEVCILACVHDRSQIALELSKLI
jgi:hypothetical protein